MLRESSKIIHLEPIDSPLRYVSSSPLKILISILDVLFFRSQFVTLRQEESDLEGYIEMVENIA